MPARITAQHVPQPKVVCEHESFERLEDGGTGFNVLLSGKEVIQTPMGLIKRLGRDLFGVMELFCVNCVRRGVRKIPNQGDLIMACSALITPWNASLDRWCRIMLLRLSPLYVYTCTSQQNQQSSTSTDLRNTSSHGFGCRA